MLLPKLSEPLKGIKLAMPEISQHEHERKLAEVRAIADAEIARLKQELAELREGVIKRVDDEYKSMVKEIGHRLPDLVLMLVKRVWGGVEIERQNIETIVDEVLNKSAPEGEALEVYMSTEDYALIMEEGDSFKDKYPDVVLKKDSKLRRGDCLVRSKFGLIDATIDTKLKQVRQELG